MKKIIICIVLCAAGLNAADTVRVWKRNDTNWIMTFTNVVAIRQCKEVSDCTNIVHFKAGQIKTFHLNRQFDFKVQ